jgi:integrase
MAASLKPARLWLKAAERNRQAVWMIKDASGRRISTGCAETDWIGAQEALARHLEALERERVIRHRPEKQGGHPSELLVANIMNVYVRDKQGAVKRPEELEQRARALLAYFGRMRVAEINATTSTAYAAQRSSPSAARRELEDLGAAIGYCQKLDMLPPGWRANIVLPPKAAPRTRWLTHDEAARLIWAAWRYREMQNYKATDRATRQHVARFILVGLYTGTRAGAICNAALTPAIGRGYVDLENGYFHRRGLGVAETKKQQPPIRIPPRLLTHMRRWRRLRISNSAVIEFAGEPVKSVRKAFARAAADAGLVGVSPHTLRHTAISWAVQAGVDIYRIADFFGLTVPLIERVYGHLAPDNVVGDAITRRRTPSRLAAPANHRRTDWRTD